MGRLQLCKNRMCERVTGGAVYCCGGCIAADEGNWEVGESGTLGHTDWCNERWAKRLQEREKEIQRLQLLRFGPPWVAKPTALKVWNPK